MILGVLHVFLLKFQTQLLLTGLFLLKLVIVVRHRLDILFQHFFDVFVTLLFLFVLFLALLELPLVLVSDLCDQDSVVCLAAILKQDLKDLPNACDNLVVLLSRRQDLLEKLEEAYRVDEERSVNPVDFITADVGVQEALAIDTVPIDRVLVLWLG